MSDRWQVILEEYNNNTSDGTECWMELGAAYQLSRRVQLDISSDLCLSAPKSYWNLSLGVAWQITRYEEAH